MTSFGQKSEAGPQVPVQQLQLASAALCQAFRLAFEPTMLQQSVQMAGNAMQADAHAQALCAVRPSDQAQPVPRLEEPAQWHTTPQQPVAVSSVSQHPVAAAQFPPQHVGLQPMPAAGVFTAPAPFQTHQATGFFPIGSQMAPWQPVNPSVMRAFDQATPASGYLLPVSGPQQHGACRPLGVHREQDRAEDVCQARPGLAASPISNRQFQDAHEGSMEPVKRSRLVWTHELHERFVAAVHQAGGIDVAVPKIVLEHMNVSGLTRDNVASHLQKYRLQVKRARSGLDSQAAASSLKASRTEAPYSAERAVKGGDGGPAPAAGLPPVPSSTLLSGQCTDQSGQCKAIQDSATCPASNTASCRTTVAVPGQAVHSPRKSALQPRDDEPLTGEHNAALALQKLSAQAPAAACRGQPGGNPAARCNVRSIPAPTL